MEASRLTPLGVDPSSPISADAERAERIQGPVPSFASVPPKPGDIRSAVAYKTGVTTLVVDKRTLNQWSNANPPGIDSPSVTDAYAAAQRIRVGNEAPVTQDKQAETESYVKRGHTAVGNEPAPNMPPAPTHPTSPQN